MSFQDDDRVTSKGKDEGSEENWDIGMTYILHQDRQE